MLNSLAGKLVRLLVLPVLALATVLLVIPSQAIIIRHDKNARDYRARESDFPAVFFLERQDIGKTCVATLIDPQWAITAAHCATITSLRSNLRDGGGHAVMVSGQQYLIDLLVVHPNYLPDSPQEVDLALLKFSAPLEMPRPIEINAAQDEAGAVVSLLGWGFYGLGTTGRQFNDGSFRMAQNRVESADRRLAIRFDDPRQQISEVLDLEGMPSLGDSGGPALVQGPSGWLLAGIAVGEVMDESFTEETQGSYGSIAVYERVSRHLEWIRRTIREQTPDQ
jgi:secreted trypsin-like serine protease